MAGPHPVVGVAAEVADRRGGRADQTDVLEYLHHEGEIAVAAEEALHLNLHALVLGLQTLGQRPGVLLHDAGALRLAGNIGHVAQQVGRHVEDAAHEADFEPRHGQLLGVVHRPEAVLEVVVIDRRQRLDRAVAAMVVGEHEAFGRDDLARASAAEDHDGVLERRTVDAVDVLGLEAASLVAHVRDVHLLEVGQQPHALVGGRRAARAEGRCKQ